MKMQIDEKLSAQISDDAYLSEKSGRKHYKIAFEGATACSDAGVKTFAEGLEKLGGVIFGEIPSGAYELSKLMQAAGFRFLCASCGWIGERAPQTEPVPECRVVPVSEYDKYEKRISEIALAFDTSHYENFALYKPFVRHMYRDKVLLQWRKHGEMVIFFVDGDPAAFTTLSCENGQGWLLSSCVDWKYRGHKCYVGMILRGMKYLLEDKKAASVKLECLASNTPVLRAWERLGFRPNYATEVYCRGLY